MRRIWKCGFFRDESGPKIMTDYLEVKNRKGLKNKEENNH